MSFNVSRKITTESFLTPHRAGWAKKGVCFQWLMSFIRRWISSQRFTIINILLIGEQATI